MKRGSFDFEDRRQVAEVVGECAKQGVQIVSVHGSLELDYKSRDEGVRATVIAQTLDTIRFAEHIGASVFVAHFGWAESAHRTVTELLRRTAGFGVRLSVENMGGPVERYFAIVDEIASHRFGLTLDIGHARDGRGVNPFTSKRAARRTLDHCGARIIHLHLHEVFDIADRPDHRPPLHPDGIMQWGEILAGIRALGYTGALLFEDGRGENPDEWLAMTGAFPDGFVRRYRR